MCQIQNKTENNNIQIELVYTYTYFKMFATSEHGWYQKDIIGSRKIVTKV